MWIVPNCKKKLHFHVFPRQIRDNLWGAYSVVLSLQVLKYLDKCISNMLVIPVFCQVQSSIVNTAVHTW